MIDRKVIDRFIKYALFDEIGDVSGVKKDAPESVKQAYKKFVTELERARKNGVKV